MRQGLGYGDRREAGVAAEYPGPRSSIRQGETDIITTVSGGGGRWSLAAEAAILAVVVSVQRRGQRFAQEWPMTARRVDAVGLQGCGS